MNLEKTIAYGMHAQLTPDGKARVDECVNTLKIVLSKRPKNEAIVAYMMFSVAVLEESRNECLRP